MIDKELLDILVCPNDHSALVLADQKLVAGLNRAISAGQVTSCGGQPVGRPVEGGLICREEALLYPMIDNIPVLLADDAIPLGQIPEGD